MLMNETVDKLIAMRFTAMADSFRLQMDDPGMNGVNFEDRFSMIVDSEYARRKDNRLKRLIRNADFEQPDACIAGIDYHSGRILNRNLISRLATCEYITEYRNIFITGAFRKRKDLHGLRLRARRLHEVLQGKVRTSAGHAGGPSGSGKSRTILKGAEEVRESHAAYPGRMAPNPAER